MTHPTNRTPLQERVFCNRTINFEHIACIGFDMDYTLAEYTPDFEILSYRLSLQKLVNKGYPKQILNYSCDMNFMVRGLAIDKENGNIIKLDRHRYVKAAYHGLKPLSREDRKRLYDTNRTPMYVEPSFALIDTLFSLAEAYLFAQLVDLKDQGSIEKPYSEIYKDVRAAIDLVHSDGSLKKEVARNPDKYILRDPNLVPTLRALSDSGRKLFIATNSYWEYTNVVMNYLFGNDTRELNTDWLELFEVVVTGSQKPVFFLNSKSLYEVADLKQFLLKNVDAMHGHAKVYQGGGVKHLHSFLGVERGSAVLYVGDHIYGDILRSKKDLGWRTMLIVPELDKELKVLKSQQEEREVLDSLLLQNECIDEELLEIELKLAGQADDSKNQDLYEKLADLRHQARQAKELYRSKLKAFHKSFHPRWGQLLKTGHQNSRFADQIEGYACLYTSRVSNMRHYSVHRVFRSTRDEMPHDFIT